MLNAGPATVAGLRWLASGGAAPLGARAGGLGMGRGRLQPTRPRPQGAGSLISATGTGVQVWGINAAALSAAPAPTTWAHYEACAWTAAWLTARGRTMI